jgi:hypothetical protein
MSDVVPSRAETGSADSILSDAFPRANCSADGLAGLPTAGSVRARLAYSQPRLVSLSVGGGTAGLVPATSGDGVGFDNVSPNL